MAQPEHQDENTYLFDHGSAAEMGRLLLQDRLLNEAMGGLLPECSDEERANIHQVLDIACGPGGWALSLARTYPHMQITAIDISELMITFAQSQATRENLHTVRFHEMNALQPLEFSDDTFDLVNMRAAMAFIPRDAWPAVVKECMRITRPGGIIRLTEFDTPGITNSPAFEEGTHQAAAQWHQRNLGFSPADGSNIGITFMLGKFLTDAGFHKLRYYPSVIDFSYGAPFHQTQAQNVSTAFQQSIIAMKRFGLLPPEAELHATRLGEKLHAEMYAENFRGLQYWLTAHAKKPALA